MTLVKRLFATDAKAATDMTVPRDRDVVYADLPLAGMWGNLRLAPDYSATYEEIVRKQLWARIAVNKISYSIGRLPLKTFEGDTPESRERVRGSSLPALIDRPNETKDTGITPGFLARVVYDLLVYGNAIVVKAQVRPDAPALQLMPSCPRYWSIADDGQYVYRKDDSRYEERFDSWRIIHIVEPGPSTDGFGRSRLEAARLTLAIEYAAQRLGEATFNNGARPGGIINVKNVGAGKEKAEVVARFKDEILARFGGVSKAGLPAVLEGDVTWLAMSHNLDDAAVVNHRQLTREEIAALYDIPQPAIGILDESNFASIDALHVMLYQDTLGWPVKLIESAFNAQLVRGVTEWAGQFLEFDLNAVMRGALAERLRAYQIGITSSIYTSDEVRGWENLPPMADEQPEAGQLRFPVNYATSPTPVGVSANGATP